MNPVKIGDLLYLREDITGAGDLIFLESGYVYRVLAVTPEFGKNSNYVKVERADGTPLPRSVQDNWYNVTAFDKEHIIRHPAVIESFY